MYRFSKKVSRSNLTGKLPWAKTTFTKFVEATNNLTKLVEKEKHFTKFSNNFAKFVEFENNYTKFIEYANNFKKFKGLTNNFVEAAINFKKLVRLAINFWRVRKTRKNLMKFVDWKVGFKCLKVFLYLRFTRLNILIGKHKFFVNTFHVSQVLSTNKLNSGRYIRVDKILAAFKKRSLR